MAGYTRRSVGDIINGLEITAPPLNAEFNQIEDAFDGSTGHTHDGTTGQGPKINLVSSVSGILPAVHGGTGGKNNFSATTDPTVTDDASQSYAVGSLWENVTTGRVYICIGNFTGAAVWRQLVVVDGTASAILPETTDTVDLGSPSARFQDLYLAGGLTGQGNGSVGGTWTVTGALTANGGSTLNGLTTAAQVDVNSGTIDNTVIGGATPSPITGTQITANSGFIGSVTGDVSGNVTSTGTSSFNNINASGTITGAVTGDIIGNITSAGTSTFNNVTVTGTLNMDGATTATIENLTDPVNPQDAATRNYVDTELANLVAAAPSTLDTLNELAAALGDDANFSTTMTNALAGKVADTGDTMTGDLLMSSGAKVTGLPMPTLGSDAGSKAYIDQQDNLQVSRSGDSMSGPLAMGANNITGLLAPTANDHAATKGYTDSILGSATAASASAAAAATSEANAAQSASAAAGHAATAQSAIASSQQFLDTYFIGTSQPTGPEVTSGDLWFDQTNNLMKVYGSNGWQSAGSSVNGTVERQDYTATAGQTSFAAVYDTGYVDVYLNGVKLAPSDFTATDGANVVLASAAAAGDNVSIVSFGTFELADHYNRTTVDNLIDDVETLALAGI